MKILELYSGIGGMHYAFAESGVAGEIVASVDINTVANEVYKHNFPQVRNMNRNIGSLSSKEIASMKVDTILMSPPCQPFTRVGLQKDSDDNRSCSLFHILNLIPQMAALKHVLVENVKGFEGSRTRDALVACLVESGFDYKELILSPCQFGIPNTRHRYYLLAKRKNLQFCFADSTLTCSIPEMIMRHWPNDFHVDLASKDKEGDEESSEKCYRLRHIVENNVDTEAYLLSDQTVQKRGSVLDVRTPESRGSCCFTKAYGRYIEGTGSVYSPFAKDTVAEKLAEYRELRESLKDFSEPLIALKLRFFTPREVSKLMCFPQSFGFPDSITNKQRYRLLGNSINVHVVSILIRLLNCSENFSSALE